MDMNSTTYNRCACEKCGSHYATIINSEEELNKEACPGCGAKNLKILGPLTQSEISSMFYGGG